MNGVNLVGFNFYAVLSPLSIIKEQMRLSTSLTCTFGDVWHFLAEVVYEKHEIRDLKTPFFGFDPTVGATVASGVLLLQVQGNEPKNDDK